VTAPSRATIAGQAYLDLRRKARQDRRPVDELIQLYVLEGFLARLAQTPFAERFVLKGGMLLAALGERRPTRDIDLQASTTGSDTGTMLAAVRQIAGTPLPDGVVFDAAMAILTIHHWSDYRAGLHDLHRVARRLCVEGKVWIQAAVMVCIVTVGYRLRRWPMPAATIHWAEPKSRVQGC